MKVTVDFSNDCNSHWAPDESLCTQWIRAALDAAAHYQDSQVSVSLVSPQVSADLNQRYRGKSGATNVLSFPSDYPDTLANTVSFKPLGDIVVCPGIVEQEATAQRKPLAEHWAHMLVHGVLHLLGYDHQLDDDAQKMEALEVNALQALGISDPYLIGY